MQQLKFFGCLLAIVASLVPLHGVSISYIGDVEIYVNDTDWKCDKIYCPPETHICRVTKHKLEPDATQVQRVNTCYSENNEVLTEAINYDPISATENISLNVTSYRTGVVSSSSNIGGGGGSFYTGNNYNYVSTNGEPFDQKQLEISMANVNRINAEVEENLRNINEQIEREMQLLKENLERNLGHFFKR